MNITFLVTAEVDRDSGLFASRDELSEKFDEALAGVLDDVDLSGVGPNSDSQYSVSEWTVRQLDAKAERAALVEYDDHVAQDYPGDAAVRAQARAAQARVRELESQLARANAKLAEKREANAEGATRIMFDVYSDTPRYLPEDEDIYFQFGPERDGSQTLCVSFRAGRRRNAAPELEIRSLGSYVSVAPRSGNVIAVRPTE